MIKHWLFCNTRWSALVMYCFYVFLNLGKCTSNLLKLGLYAFKNCVLMNISFRGFKLGVLVTCNRYYTVHFLQNDHSFLPTRLFHFRTTWATSK